jgi:hypothetical protein
MIIYTQDFEGYSGGDIFGQDNWAHGSGHTGGGGPINAIAGGIGASASAALQAASGYTTWYYRPFTDIIKQGKWYRLTFDIKANSSLSAGTTITYLAQDEARFPWSFEVDYLGNVNLTDKNGSNSLGSITLDADHSVEIVVDENGTINVWIDSGSVMTDGVAMPANINRIDFYFADVSVTQADAFLWDNIVLTLREQSNVYKFYVGK